VGNQPWFWSHRAAIHIALVSGVHHVGFSEGSFYALIPINLVFSSNLLL